VLVLKRHRQVLEKARAVVTPGEVDSIPNRVCGQLALARKTRAVVNANVPALRNAVVLADPRMAKAESLRKVGGTLRAQSRDMLVDVLGIFL
jgi:hypothetical protein